VVKNRENIFGDFGEYFYHSPTFKEKKVFIIRRAVVLFKQTQVIGAVFEIIAPNLNDLRK